MSETTEGRFVRLAKELYPELSGGRVTGLGEYQQRREDPVTAHRMRLDGYAEARALAHEAVTLIRASGELPGNTCLLELAVKMLERATDLLQPEPK